MPKACRSVVVTYLPEDVMDRVEVALVKNSIATSGIDATCQFLVLRVFCGDLQLWLKAKTRDTWEMPGGKREKGETLAQTAVRELQEETGITGVTPVHRAWYSTSYGGQMSYGALYDVVLPEDHPAAGSTTPPAEFEIAEMRWLREPPAPLRYPAIYPALLAHPR